MRKRFSRRSLVQALSVGGAAYCLRDFIPWFTPAHAATYTQDDHPFLIYCTFDGGWDSLLACDPRDATDSAVGEGKAINPGYDIIAANNPTLSMVTWI